MSLTEQVRKPLEALAGEPYPDLEALVVDYTATGASTATIEWAVDSARYSWRQSLIHFNGMKAAIQSMRHKGDI